jgi:uncharacterized protein (DUF2141 family)
VTKSQNIEVSISGIKSTNGQVLISVFKNNESFQAEKPFISKKFEKKNIVNGEMTVAFNLERGIYGLALLDDEDNNNKMDYNFFGMPEEGFGFSNYYFKGFIKPIFDTFKFEVKNNQKQKILIRTRYM